MTRLGIHTKLCDKVGIRHTHDASILAGQWIPYFEQVFSDYANGDRQMLDDKMKEKVDPLSDEDITALIHFYGSLQ
jgi:sulfide dehydrogenase cytochrome subunit